MDRWQAMRIFTQVAESGSFVGAARLLHMSPPAVTRAISALEETVGARLLIRTTRTVKLTEAGARYVEDCRRILRDIAEAEANAAGSFDSPAGTLTVTAPTQFGRLHVLPILLEFLDRYPAVSVRAIFLDRVVNLIEEGIDVAIRIAHLPSSGLIATNVGHIRQVACGSPGYFERHGEPKVPADLAHHQVITRDGIFGGGDWRFGRDGEISVHVASRFQCNTNDTAIAAAVAGAGISLFQSYQVAPEIAAGRLQAVLVEYESGPVPVHIVHAEGRTASARLRAFVDFAAARLRANPVING